MSKWSGKGEYGKEVGFGTWTDISGATDTGECTRGKRHGPWVNVTSNGDVYDSVFDNDRFKSQVQRVSDAHKTTTTLTTTIPTPPSPQP